MEPNFEELHFELINLKVFVEKQNKKGGRGERRKGVRNCVRSWRGMGGGEWVQSERD